MELGFAWHHSKLPKHARVDFEDMIANNCNSVLIAASENDLDYWYPNLVEIIDIAKELELKVWLNFWAFGGVFGGEPPSVFLHRHHRNRQITAESKECVPAACINHPEFRNHFYGTVNQVLKDTKIDGIFIDEPHHYWTLDMSEFTCVCDVCQEKFESMFGTKMPAEYTDSVKQFREKTMHEFLIETTQTIKSTKSQTEVCVCINPSDIESFGTPSWDQIASIPEVDMFSTDPYFHVFGKDREWAVQMAKKTIDISRKYGKRSQLWLQMFRLPKGEESSVASLVPEYIDLGVDSVFGWCYLANKGTSIASDNPDLLWNLVTQEYRRIG